MTRCYEVGTVLGTDAQGREILSFIDGHVPWQDDQQLIARTDASLAEVGMMLRRYHDLTAGTTLAGPSEVVCHNDLSPRNTVYRDDGDGLRRVAFIDWDLAAPGAVIQGMSGFWPKSRARDAAGAAGTGRRPKAISTPAPS